ncbi:helix-turn-helix transcriptional regulator [Exilibacterium tricleocarpae]|uniref:Helix-turn-helix transcriptional regulator n=1 Tax=Exilibacterium tricleocarpae TaxID=2591008 RepID=A0A545U741_9GAMM|nr:helix-turn-helix transcriptional regulator [Exilibacterium tricleocarpae]
MPPHPHLLALGRRIKHLRLEKGYKQKRLAEHIGIDRSYIGGVERGERNPGIVNLVRIAMALEVEVGDLFPPVTSLSSES